MGRITKAGEQAVLIILSFLGTYGVCYLLELTGSRYPDYSVMSVFLAGGIYGLLKRISGGRTRRRFLYGAAVSFFLSLFLILGYQLAQYGMTDCGVKGKGMILVRSCCLAIALYPFCDMLFGLLEKLPPVRGREKKPWKKGAVFGITLGAVFLLWIPVWMAYYPIVMS